MQKLYNLLKNYTLEDILDLEKQDPQYKSLEKLYKNIEDRNLFLGLILANSIVCYQLSSTGEKYWEEFSENASDYFLGKIRNPPSPLYQGGIEQDSSNLLYQEIITFLKQFLPNSKGNKRLLEVKFKRLIKLEIWLDDFLDKTDFYTNDLLILRDDLAIAMNQKKDAKTIVFAIKMIMYGISIINSKEKPPSPLYQGGIEQDFHNLLYKGSIEQVQGRFPTFFEGQLNISINSRTDYCSTPLIKGARGFSSPTPHIINSISIPIDSRLTKIFEIYKEDYTDIKKFYRDLSIKLGISEIHLDVILWMNYEKFIQK